MDVFAFSGWGGGVEVMGLFGFFKTLSRLPGSAFNSGPSRGPNGKSDLPKHCFSVDVPSSR